VVRKIIRFFIIIESKHQNPSRILSVCDFGFTNRPLTSQNSKFANWQMSNLKLVRDFKSTLFIHYTYLELFQCLKIGTEPRILPSKAQEWEVCSQPWKG